MYRAVTRQIEVEVEPSYLEDRSDPDSGQYFWAYRIIIANHSDETIQLQSRYWRIVDANGKVEEVAGPGVVGEQPILNPGDSYQYTSGCPLTTPSGTMVGHYEMLNEGGLRFRVQIPAFSLDMPGAARTLN